MAYCPLELLDDLAHVFADLRNWVGIVEKGPGVSSIFHGPSLPRDAELWFASCGCAMGRGGRLRAEAPVRELHDFYGV